MGCGLWGTGLATAGVLFVEHVLNTHTHTHGTHKEHIHETTTMSGLTALGERPLPEPTARPQLDTGSLPPPSRLVPYL